MNEEKLKSKCCGAEVEVSTAEDLGVTSGGTSCYICKKCNKPCDLKPYEVNYPRNEALEILKEKADTNNKEMQEAVEGIKTAKLDMFAHYKDFVRLIEEMPKIILEMEEVARSIDWISKDEK